VQVFIFSDFFSQSFCGSLHLLGIHRHTRQFLQQLTPFLKAGHGPHGTDHACECRRQGGVFYAQVLIARTEPVAALGAMVVGPLQLQRAQHADDVLGPACDVARFLSTRTTQTCTGFIGKVGIETLLNSVGREPQGTLAQRDFQGLEIQLREGFPT
jgi:hypothetical protein